MSQDLGTRDSDAVSNGPTQDRSTQVRPCVSGGEFNHRSKYLGASDILQYRVQNEILAELLHQSMTTGSVSNYVDAFEICNMDGMT